MFAEITLSTNDENNANVSILKRTEYKIQYAEYKVNEDIKSNDDTKLDWISVTINNIMDINEYTIKSLKSVTNYIITASKNKNRCSQFCKLCARDYTLFFMIFYVLIIN